MKRYLIFLVFLFSENVAQEDSFHYGATVNDIWSLMKIGAKEKFLGCKSNVSFTADDIGYLLYNRQNKNPIILTPDNLDKIDVTKDTKIIINGWMGQTTDLIEMYDAYLARYDCNMIAVDYFNVTNTLYNRAYCNTIRVADFVSDFLCTLYDKELLDFDRVHMVGFSLGGQLSGLVGKRTQQTCNQKLERITALDPAGPIYQNQDRSKKLDKTDAKFVDVIHSNMGMLGYYGSLGHVDFFLNCGSSQPGCIKISKIPKFVEMFITFINCSHSRSFITFVESISGKGPIFNSTSCSTCPDNISIGTCKGGDTINPKYTIMGEDCPRNPPAQKFMVETNKKSPFAKG